MNIVSESAFSDHHPYEASDLRALHKQAEALDARLITTEKDYLRLPHIEGVAVETLPVEMCWDNEEALLQLIQKHLKPQL